MKPKHCEECGAYEGHVFKCSIQKVLQDEHLLYKSILKVLRQDIKTARAFKERSTNGRRGQHTNSLPPVFWNTPPSTLKYLDNMINNALGEVTCDCFSPGMPSGFCSFRCKCKCHE